MGLNVFTDHELIRFRHTAWLGGEGGSERVSQSLAGEKQLAGICMLRPGLWTVPY